MEKTTGRIYVLLLILMAVFHAVEKGLKETNPFIAAIWVAITLVHLCCAVRVLRDGVK